MTVQTYRGLLVALGVILLTIVALSLVIREQDLSRACRSTQQNYDTLARLVSIPSRDPLQRDQLLEVLGERPTC